MVKDRHNFSGQLAGFILCHLFTPEYITQQTDRCLSTMMGEKGCQQKGLCLYPGRACKRMCCCLVHTDWVPWGEPQKLLLQREVYCRSPNLVSYHYTVKSFILPHRICVLSWVYSGLTVNHFLPSGGKKKTMQRIAKISKW